jgi:hypothetical protein
MNNILYLLLYVFCFNESDQLDKTDGEKYIKALTFIYDDSIINNKLYYYLYMEKNQLITVVPEKICINFIFFMDKINFKESNISKEDFKHKYICPSKEDKYFDEKTLRRLNSTQNSRKWSRLMLSFSKTHKNYLYAIVTSYKKASKEISIYDSIYSSKNIARNKGKYELVLLFLFDNEGNIKKVWHNVLDYD